MIAQLPAPMRTKVRSPTRSATTVAVLVVVEGIHDVEFLRRTSAMLHAAEPGVADLDQMQRDGRLVFLPVGGSDRQMWAHRLAPLEKAEFHLFDRDFSPLTERHQAAADAVNRRQGCIAALTGFRQIENYVHPRAMETARGFRIEHSGDDDLPDLVAKQAHATCGGRRAWHEVPSRRRRRMKNHAKRWLNTEAVSHMTPALLDEQDPQGDVRSWLEAIVWLADNGP